MKPLQVVSTGPPETGKIKINVDGAVFAEKHAYGGGDYCKGC